MEPPSDVVEIAHSEMPEILGTCNALPDFDTLQLVDFLPIAPSSGICRLVVEKQRAASRTTTETGFEGVGARRERCEGPDNRLFEETKDRASKWKGRKETTLRVVESNR